MSSAGHLFVVDGDLTKLACDAVLIPTDRTLNVTKSWSSYLGMPEPGCLPGHSFRIGERVIPFEGVREQAGPEVWLGDLGATPTADDEWFADGLDQFVRRVADDLKERLRNTGVPPRLAVNVAGSGEGGFMTKRGTLFDTIVPRLQTAAHQHEVDVVLVCWGQRSYAAAQRARRKHGLRPTYDPRLEPTIHRLAGHARRNQLVLFIGAGVSMGAGLASWSGLLESLRMTIPDGRRPDKKDFERLDHLDRAALTEQLLGRERFDAALREQISGSGRYSLAHGLLASLRTAENVTTNYDTLFETAARTAKREGNLAVLPYDSVAGEDQWLLKLHGSVDPQDQLVLTRSDYLGLPQRSTALFGILQAMLLTRHMLFIGYSLEDDTFHKVMHEVRKARGHKSTQLGTVLTLFADDLRSQLWSDDLELVPMATHRAPDASSEQREAEFNRAARKLDIVLDAVALESADVLSFLLDRTYDAMLSPDERLVRSHLENALAAARRIEADSPIGEGVAHVLRQFGAEPARRAGEYPEFEHGH